MRLSARGYHRVLRVARTLADLDGAEKVGRLDLKLAEVIPPATVARKPGHRGEHDISRQNHSRAGTPGDLAYLW